MIRVPLVDFNAEFGSFAKEAEILGLDYKFEHTNHLNENDSFVVLTDKTIYYNWGAINIKKYFWIMEPRVIHPWAYDYIYNNYSKFEKVFSHDREFCKVIPNAVWYPWGSYFIPLDQHNIYNKSKNVSIVASAKNLAEGHQMRHSIISRYHEKFDGIKQGGQVEPKLLWHKDFRFSVVIENSFSKGYFTEKLLDCFRTGVIPIYKGDPDVLSYGFDPNGIILFDQIQELGSILDSINDHLYLSKKESVEYNFKKSFDYLFPWKYIYENYLKEELK